MHLFSPERKKLENGLPYYYDDLGPVGPITKLSLDIRENTVIVSILLLDKPNCGAWYNATMSRDDLPGFVKSFELDPEWVLRTLFKWPGMKRKSGTSSDKPVLTLESLANLKL